MMSLSGDQMQSFQPLPTSHAIRRYILTVENVKINGNIELFLCVPTIHNM